jgi:membrane fusion protein, heavy metal efflux system
VTRAFAILLVAATACGTASSSPVPGPASATESAEGKAGDHDGHGAGDGHGHAAPPATAPAPALCAHAVPAELCTRCNPDLVPVFQAQEDWCAEHGVPESQCRACNPGLTFTAAAAPADWCAEHAIAESKCTKCNPGLVAKFIAANDYCREHGFPESACPFCHPEVVRAAGREPPATAPFEGVIRLASGDTVRDAGIEVRRAERRAFSRSLEVVGQLELDGHRHAQLSAPADALVQAVKVDVGDEVRAGQPLVVLASSAVGAGQAQLAAARARLDLARAAVARERALAVKGISSARDLQEAEREQAAAQAEHGAARAALGAAGSRGSGTDGRLVLAAPFRGTVVSRAAVVGRTAGASEVLVEVADLSTVWAQLDVPEGDAALVRPGQQVRVVVEAGGAVREARVTRVASTVDPRTRTVRVRVDLPNPDRALRAGALVRATIAVTDAQEAILVPRDAIQQAEGRTLVFVREGPVTFRPVRVDVGASTGEVVEVRAGLAPGAEVVTSGAFLLKTELLKDSIGAGCCEPGPVGG